MAVDTRDKRSSAIHPNSPWRGQLPLADGSVDQPDRQHAALFYSGIAATSPFSTEAPDFNLALALHVADEVGTGVQTTLRLQYIKQDGTRRIFDADPTLRIYSVSGAGAETEELSTTIDRIGATATYERTWTPSVAGVFIVEIRAVSATVPIQGAWPVTVRAKFDPIALALSDVLVARN